MNSPQLVRDNLDDRIIKQFFEENSFYLIYQLKVSLKDCNEIVGVEAFLRLKQAGDTFLTPQAILPVVERMGLLPDLTEFIITQVTQDWEKLVKQGYQQAVSVNIDLCIFENTESLSKIISIVTQSNMPAEKLTIDIVIKDDEEITQAAINGLNRFRMMGANLALDIFSDKELDGDRIESLPVDEIKFGRALTCRIFDSDSSQITIRKYLSIATKMALNITAVGIENEEEYRWLTDFGIDYGQGYLFGQPTEIENLALVNTTESEQARQTSSQLRLKLLVVEDDIQYGKLMMELLSEHYEFYLADNEESAMKIIAKEKPEILILDIHLKMGNGFNVANIIKELYDETLFSIIFVSGNDDQENRIKAYEAGAVAFISKPIPVVDLVTKINRYASLHRKRKEQSKKIQDTESMAFQSMREASHYGDIIQFMKEISHRTDEPGISKSLFKYMENRGLSCSIVFNDKQNVCSFDQNGSACSPIELNVFELLKNRSRLYEFGNRLIVNDKHISFLVKKMPPSEIEKGQVRDYVAVLIECMEARYLSLLQNRILESVVGDLSNLAQEAALSMESAKGYKEAMVDKFSLDIGMSFHVLELSLDQEDFLKKIVSDMINSREADEISTDDIVSRIQNSVSLLTSTLAEITVLGAENEDDESGDDVELF
ncbi:MAG: EAL domain-containing protein (putative c-di-GMP-specific phosphodiesterase class I) [Oceanicoccus sp.]|jgi:EAL domain-containing protein (putative c-di-GMP-specific phosphodiesterase class I)/response regulator of citrate/malate metabolism